MTADTSRSAVHERSQQAPVGDLVALHAREADRLLAYLCSSDRKLGLADAEAVCQQAFLEVRASWPNLGPYSRAEVYVFAAAQRIASGRSRTSSGGDALTESAPDYWDRADVARLTVLQDSLDKLSLVPRQAVILREMCGFAPSEVAEIIGLPEPAVESARADALRSLVPLIENGTSNGQARRGPLSPEDFAALGRVLQHTDPRRIEDRQRFAMSLGQPPAMTQTSPSAPGGQQGGLPGVPATAVFSPQQQAVAPAFGAGAPPVRSAPPAPAPSAPATSVLGGPSGLSGDALFAPTGPSPASPGDPSAPAGWMGGFGARRPAAAPGAAAAFGQPPTVSQPTVTQPAMSQPPTISGRPGFAGAPMTGIFTGPAPSAPAPQPVAPQQPTFAAPPPAPTYSSTPTYTPPAPSYGPTSLMPTNLRPGTTPLDSPTFNDSNLNVETPIFDSVSAWFSRPPTPEPGTNGHSHPAASHWASLQDRGWREASARAAAGPQVAGATGSGLPVRAPGANMVPSAAEVALGMTRQFSREAPRTDPGRVRHRLDSFQQGVQSARQQRDQRRDEAVAVPAPEPERPTTKLSHPTKPSGRDAVTGPAGIVLAEPSAAAEPAARRGREGGFGAFYRDYLPHLLALLMVEGARPPVAAQLAQDAMSEAYREWAQLENPREWTRQVALASWAAQRRTPGSTSGTPAGGTPAPGAGSEG